MNDLHRGETRNQEPKLFVAMKAFIIHQGKILVLRESAKYVDGSNQNKYDVVGGRIKPGQHFKESLLREISEETGLKVTVGKPFFVNEWRPTVKGERWHIVGTFFECHADDNQVILSEDHDHCMWINPKEYAQYPLIDNLMPAFEAYLQK